MIKLVYCVYRRNDISETDFHEYWLNVHGPKVRSVARDIGAVKYVQSHICAPELNQMLKESRGLAPAYDGITEVWWENAEAMAKAVGTTEGAAGMQMLLEDESTFIDFSQSAVFMTTETEIFNYTAAGEDN
jgi:hypothetical protein